MDEPPKTMTLLEKNRVTFLDLSAELRNFVYEHCLVAPRKIHIRRLQATTKPFWGCAITRKPPTPTAIWTSAELESNILLVCKTINKEATAILYGSNAFTLHTGQSDVLITQPWTTTIGSSVQHLRDLMFRGSRTKDFMIQTFDSLKPAEFLASIRISCSCSRTFEHAESLAKALYPLVLELHKGRRNTKQPMALSVLTIDPTCEGDYELKVKRILGKKFEQYDIETDMPRMSGLLDFFSKMAVADK